MSLKLFWYYHRLALSDLIRLWSTTQHHVIIVAGICLPILLLFGLKRGHVASLRQELLTSPTGRQVIFWSAQKGELLTAEGMQELSKSLSHIDVIIPDQQRIVRLGKIPADAQTIPQEETVTLYSTRRGDPVLKQLHVDILEPGEQAILLPDHVAEKLGVKAGERIQLTIDRDSAGVAESHHIDFLLKGTYPAETEQSLVGFADMQILDRLEQYVRGYGVPEFHWGAAKRAVQDRYAAYLAFCEAANDLRPDDIDTLKERGLNVVPVTDPAEKLLYGILDPQRAEGLRVYKIASSSSLTDPRRRLTFSPSELSEVTQADDVLVPWNEPTDITQAGTEYKLLGFTLPKRTWLRDYCVAPELAHTYDHDQGVVRLLGPAGSVNPISFEIPLKDGDRLPLRVLLPTPPEPAELPAETQAGTEPEEKPAVKEAEPPLGTDPEAPAEAPPADAPITPPPPATDPPKEPPAAANATESPAAAPPGDAPPVAVPAPVGPTLVILPVETLAQLSFYHLNLARFDVGSQLFVAMPDPPVYDKARLFSQTIDDVPQVVKGLMGKGFAVMSESTRIKEIHGQDQSLQILVWVVGLGVFTFGVITVVSVLLDSTDRKRGTIGVLRVMGVSRFGIFYLVLLRAAAIGLLAGVTSFALGKLTALLLAWQPTADQTWLAWKPVIQVSLDPWDVGMVFCGALICSCLGAIWPALRASLLDPFDAIVEGRFR